MEAEIVRIRALGLYDLRTLWRSTFRALPPLVLTEYSICAGVGGEIREAEFQ